MKRLLLSTAAVALLSGASYAADLPVMEAPAPIVAPTPVAQNWTGFYLGIHGGYGWANADGNCHEYYDRARDRYFDCDGDRHFDRDSDGDGDDFNLDDSDFEGAVIGGQLGANFQWNWFVLGVEGDASWSGIDLDDEFDDDDDDDGIDTSNHNDNDDDDDDDDGDAGIDWLASARLRAGVGLDRVLIYGTGGVGFAGFDADEEGDFFDDENNGNTANHNDDNDDDDDDDDEDGDSEVGWVAGGGVEFMLTDNVTLGAEYLHYEFGDGDDDDDDDDDDNNRSSADAAAGGRDRDNDNDGIGIDDVDVIRGRVNVKFGGLFGGNGG